ncbi:ABC-type multidrug transport system, ATPase and permease component [SAR116 cluster alpha proteobacterium HIMB100]|nr:ABC-type multidrug transport system, ATPase and permease component [SAR116 cluster alpha proteobacterium HIMB100]
MSDTASKQAYSLSTLSVFWPYIRPWRGRVAVATAILILVAIVLLSLGRGLAFLVDKGLGAGDPALLDRAVFVTIGLGLLIGVGSYLRMSILNHVAEQVMAAVRRALFAHVLSLPLQWFETAKTGDVLARLNADTAVVQTVLASTVSMAVRNLILLVGGLVLVVLSSAKMSVVVAAVVPVVVVPLVLLARRLRTASRAAQDALGEVSAEAEEALSGIRTVMAFAQGPQVKDRFDFRLNKALAAALSRVRLRAALSGFIFFMVVAGVAVILWIGGRDLLAGNISAGDLSSFIFYAFLVASSTGNLSELGGELQRAAGAADRIAGLLAVAPQPDEANTNMPAVSADKGLKVEFQKAGFAYPGRPDLAVLDEVSFTAEPGQKIAIVGPSGAGKTTLFQLLLRFYMLRDGLITLNGTDIAQMRLSDLRGLIGLVPQDPALFSLSIAENIAFGRPEASRAEIEAAAASAAAHDFITALDGGYDALVGEKGVRLSGGQRQRIAIARAILCNPALLLLDEATSALDSVSEAAIQEALSRLMIGRTSLVIAHRLSTVMDADKILVMSDGRLVATGTHDQLMAGSELYAELAARQLG